MPFYGTNDENEYCGMFPEKPIPLSYNHVYCLSAIGKYQLFQKVEKSLGIAPKETKLPTADGMTVDDTLLKKSAWMVLNASQVSEDVINETLEMIKPLTKVKGFYKGGLCNFSNGVANAKAAQVHITDIFLASVEGIQWFQMFTAEIVLLAEELRILRNSSVSKPAATEVQSAIEAEDEQKTPSK